jgi:amino-acid N-acetyltransferase
VKVRKARTSDVKSIQRLVNRYAKKNRIIPRSMSDLFDNIRDFVVGEEDGKVVGACALHVHWDDLAEIRSLAVEEKCQGRGIGKALVRRSLKEARALGVGKVFALTQRPDYFRAFGFTDAEKSSLPQKIWKDCLNCLKFPDCDESATIKTLG